MHYGKAMIQLRQSDFVAAKESGNRMVSLDATYIAGLEMLALSEFGLCNYEATIKLSDEGLNGFNNAVRFAVTKIKALHALGRLEDVKRLRNDLNQRQESGLVPSVVLALAEYYSGNMDGAITNLEQSLKDRNFRLLPLDPRKEFEKLNGNPRFDAIWEKVELPALKQ